MKGGFRKSMTWLHTWSSLVVIWVLFAIFLTGTLSFFRAEITHWMTPEHHISARAESPVLMATSYLQSVAPFGESWQISLPDSRSPVLGVNWLAEGEERQRRRGARAVIDPVSGTAIEDARETAGGNFLYRFHFELYGIPRSVGRWIVGIASMLMFIAIISGVIIHRKIFADFFSFRPGKKTASWVDAHVLGSVLALPFHIMITFTGLFLLAGTLLFWQGGNERGGQQGQNANRGHASEEQREERAQAEKPSSQREIVSLNMNAIYLEAESLLGQPISDITISKPMTHEAEVTFRGSEKSSLSHFRGGTPEVTYNVKGELIKENFPAGAEGPIATTYGVLRSLHEGHFADVLTRWLLFFSGVLGTVMVGSGALLWSQKRERQQVGKPGYEVVSALNLAGIAGLFVALGAYFWANRLVPAGIDGRADWEIIIFFCSWLACILHSVLLRQRHGWLLQLAAAGLMFLLLPALDALTSPVGLVAATTAGDWVRLSFDFVSLLTAAGLWAAAYFVLSKGRKSRARRNSVSNKKGKV
ncbi:Uncharacterized iron-regulated membrane protein [Thalassolituus maritimus]|uniref:Uncharacterized iron-regulated membrane protein n=1 Tax=Thalassolituus maritimus TaxID=484498 RepID=A0A1N7KCB3_9GAMM|nr:PepSY-associated TM helix domain-containing protein [Thalassolituus maritimus]SIS59236.1 Uncharacterized iron-regulated membrane protein [Thalassolituus maritimus]